MVRLKHTVLRDQEQYKNIYAFKSVQVGRGRHTKEAEEQQQNQFITNKAPYKVRWRNIPVLGEMAFCWPYRNKGRKKEAGHKSTVGRELNNTNKQVQAFWTSKQNDCQVKSEIDPYPF